MNRPLTKEELKGAEVVNQHTGEKWGASDENMNCFMFDIASAGFPMSRSCEATTRQENPGLHSAGRTRDVKDI